MNPALREERHALVDTVKRFAGREIAPQVEAERGLPGASTGR
jgi:hypothetical protein